MLAILLWVSSLISKRAVCPIVFSYKDMIDMEEKSGRRVKSTLDGLLKEEIFIKSPFGYTLHGMFIPVQNSKKTVIICHGITCNIYGSVKYIDLFRKKGFNVFIYDHRNHGKSGGKFTTFGYYEKYDLKACADWIRAKMGEDCILGTMGESMGAATALQNLSVDDGLTFCIADCPYSDFDELLSLRLKIEFHLPRIPLIALASLFCRYMTGMKVSEVSPIHDVNKSNTPVLFIHGDADNYIPMEMSIKLYNAKKGIKDIYIVKVARHAESIVVNKEEYDIRVSKFLMNIGVL